MQTQFSRTELILGDDSTDRLSRCRVAVFGVGGVGGLAAEALARSGIGTIDIFDDDKVCLTNLNRQVIATHDTIGMDKVDACADRLISINPNILVNRHKVFYIPKGYETKSGVPLPEAATSEIPSFREFDYMIDAIDTVTAKIDIICRAVESGTPVISAMGTGNRLDPEKLTCMDIYKTKDDPLAKIMRKELKVREITHLDVVCSTEIPIKPTRDNKCAQDCVCPPDAPRTCDQRRSVPGSSPFVPASAGLLIASVVVRNLLACS